MSDDYTRNLPGKPAQVLREWAVSHPAEVSLDDWMAIIRAEYLEHPSLSLTRAQITQLVDLDPRTADTVVERLLMSGFLSESSEGQLEQART